MSKAKTEILGPAISDFLKYEATPLTRVAVAADAGTKAGSFVTYPLRNKKLVALTDEADGKVIVQPLNCIIECKDIFIQAKAAFQSDAVMKKEGDAYGIVYVNLQKFGASDA
ncbi:MULTISPECIES: oxaloacetate decarboxylase alpha chain [Neisseria]|uniref:oxaloacetate decarboxylase alpha chain n=1 Tax=Neisseria TaxID=482 RepID=UPI0008A4DF7E|nr:MULTISPECIES: oxaloacetate decarboxylase alpha chain [Neisseria]MCL5079034.1 oxaloacetate decarboxylase alpha chain [Neisseria perflava]OFM98542.1 oxaloacetate decarboxylase alpha chain [Neisseria sp. HMSC072C05]